MTPQGEDFLKRLEWLDKNTPAKVIDFAYHEIDGWLCGQKFALCDEVLANAVADALLHGTVIALLVITFAAKAHLPARAELFARFRDRLLQEVSQAEAEQILRGLE